LPPYPTENSPDTAAPNGGFPINDNANSAGPQYWGLRPSVNDLDKLDEQQYEHNDQVHPQADNRESYGAGGLYAGHVTVAF
jgi:hypothetical protein